MLGVRVLYMLGGLFVTDPTVFACSKEYLFVSFHALTNFVSPTSSCRVFLEPLTKAGCVLFCFVSLVSLLVSAVLSVFAGVRPHLYPPRIYTPLSRHHNHNHTGWTLPPSLSCPHVPTPPCNALDNLFPQYSTINTPGIHWSCPGKSFFPGKNTPQRPRNTSFAAPSVCCRTHTLFCPLHIRPQLPRCHASTRCFTINTLVPHDVITHDDVFSSFFC